MSAAREAGPTLGRRMSAAETAERVEAPWRTGAAEEAEPVRGRWRTSTAETAERVEARWRTGAAEEAEPVEVRRRASAAEKAELAAVQAALGAEHAAVYGYGVIGGRIRDGRRDEARAAYDAHRARRDELARAVLDLGGKPEAAAAAYALPFPVPDAAAATRLAAELEDRVAGVYADLVRAGQGDRRREAAAALREAAVRAVRWRGGSVAFPGLAERSPTDSSTARPQP